MKIRTVSIAASVIAAIGLAAFGCSSSSSDAASAASYGNCPAVGSKACPNDTATAQADVDQCAKLKADAKCGSKYVDVLKCAGDNVTCDAAGKYDSAKGQAACKTQTDAYVSCVSAAPMDAGKD